MTSRAVANTGPPSFATVHDVDSLMGFFETRGITFDSSHSLFKVTPQHFMRLEIVDQVTPEITEQKRKQLLDFKNVRYGLLIDKTLQKLKFIRSNERPNTFTFDKSKRHPQERLQSIFKLLNAITYSQEPYNESLLDLFDVKELVDRFYKDYQIVREKLAKQVNGTSDGVKSIFAQVILDRIIFIYFLQAKGILPQDYLGSLYERALERKKSFYEAYLQPLFFELLNSNDKKVKEKYRSEFGEIPYLNGGLFRRREFELDGTNIHNAVWTSVFDLFDGYEWVIEDTESGGLTPEILGHIFEMSMNEGERKGSGSYYTPREATRLICEHVINRFLCENLQREFRKQWTSFDEIIRQDNRDILEFTYLALREVRLVDPAVGSGAFLVAAEDILVDYLLRLYEKLDQLGSTAIVHDKETLKKSDNSSTYHFKKHVMTENLHGVDINPGGVEICKLRLWLSMISDATKIEPLPNIEFNVRHGNSLLGFIDATGDVGDTATLEDPQSIKTKFRDRNKLIEEYRHERNTRQAGELKKRIDLLTMKYRADLDRKLCVKLHKNIERLRAEQWFVPFHWVMEFSPIFEAGGFDLVVGNPPFSRQERIPKSQKEALETRFSKYSSYVSGQMGLYGFFVILCDEILRSGGRAAYVLPSAVLRLESTRGLRQLLVERATIEDIFLRTTTSAFSNDTSLREIILAFKKEVTREGSSRLVFVGELTAREREVLSAKIETSQSQSIPVDVQFVPRGEIQKNIANLFRLVASRPELSEIWNTILDKGNSKLTVLSDYLAKTGAHMVRGVEIESGEEVSVLSTYILRDPAQAIKSGDVWSLSDVDDSSIRAVNKQTKQTVSIPTKSTVYGLRRPALLDKVDVSDRLDYVVVGDFPSARAFFGRSMPSKDLRRWREYISTRSGKLAIVRRFNISAPGTRLLACYSSKDFTPTKMLWAVRDIDQQDAEILALWLNSSLNVLQILLERIETEGAFFELSEYVLNTFFILDPRNLDRAEREYLGKVLRKSANITLPSILQQLKEKDRNLVRIDEAILRTLGFDTIQSNYIIERLHSILVKEIESLKTVMVT